MSGLHNHSFTVTFNTESTYRDPWDAAWHSRDRLLSDLIRRALELMEHPEEIAEALYHGESLDPYGVQTSSDQNFG
jgi:hypothetical protein|tara:strand:+ start:61 stop:288 length:228 start_codon:yes stop_codon:yes gene_type:complete